MFELYEKVRIVSRDLIGTIIDISENNGITDYVVESDKECPISGGYGDRFPLFDCTEESLKKSMKRTNK